MQTMKWRRKIFPFLGWSTFTSWLLVEHKFWWTLISAAPTRSKDQGLTPQTHCKPAPWFPRVSHLALPAYNLGRWLAFPWINTCVEKEKKNGFPQILDPFLSDAWDLLWGVMCPDKLQSWAKTLIPQGHCSVDDILSISTHHYKSADT